MSQSARQLADNASFQAFMNSYLKEVDPGVWHDADDWQRQTGQTLTPESHQVLELKLPSQDLTLAIGVKYRSLVGRHTLTEVHQKPLHKFNWQNTDFFTAILSLITEIYAPKAEKSDGQRQKELELMARVIESQQVMTRYLEERLEDAALSSNRFIDSEQSILFGHWLHPTPKSRQGIHDWQHRDYTPELCGRFQLHYFAVSPDLVQQGSILKQTAEQIIQQALLQETSEKTLDSALSDAKECMDKGMLLIPTHPLQAQWLLHQNSIQNHMTEGVIHHIGPLGPEFTPTSSVRTLYCESLDFMIKLSIPVKVTNSMRINMAHELEAGIAVASLFRKTEFSHKYPKFQTIDDPAYMTLAFEEDNSQNEAPAESGFELIIRENPFSNDQPNAANLSVVSIAALTQDAIGSHQSSRIAKLIQDKAKATNQSIYNTALTWFVNYWQCAIEPAIRLYDEHGIALEAHQQNSLLDVTDGYPTRYFYRDNQGFYLSKNHETRLLDLEPRLSKTDDLFYEDEMIQNRFSYYLFVNQLFSVINRLGIDQLMPERDSIALSILLLKQLRHSVGDAGQSFIDTLLSQKDMAFKGNLLTRIYDVDELQADQELAVYTKVINPFKSVDLTKINDQSPSLAKAIQSHSMLSELASILSESITTDTQKSINNTQRLSNRPEASAALNALIAASKQVALGSSVLEGNDSVQAGGQCESA